MMHHTSVSRLGWALLPIFLVIVLLPDHSPAQRLGNEGLRRRWSVYDYPDPQSQNQDQQRACGRLNVSSVCDPNRIISRTQADAIDNLISEVYRETVCPCASCRANNRGYIIRVAIMPFFERIFPDSENTTMGMLRDAQMYSYMLSEKWRMQGTCNETVLIMYAQRDNMLYTLTRRTSRVKLTDDDIKSIMLLVRHYFDESGTIADGLIEMIRRYKCSQGVLEAKIGIQSAVVVTTQKTAAPPSGQRPNANGAGEVSVPRSLRGRCPATFQLYDRLVRSNSDTED